MKYIKTLEKCLQKNNNLVKLSFCAVIVLIGFLVFAKIAHEVYSIMFIKEGFEPASELVLLHMKGCPHCVKMMPEWMSFVNNNDTGVKTRTVERKEDPQLVQRLGVKSFPTIVLLNGKGEKVKEYEGERKASAFRNFCLRNK
jgi:thiol-disulfide isomerase/thioredoxin